MAATSYPATGTSEDVLRILARAEVRRQGQEGVVLPSKPPGARAVLEPILNAAGVGLAAAFECLPAGAILSLQDKMFSSIVGKGTVPFEPEADGLTEARRLCREVEAKGAGPAALLCLMSHPPVEPEWLNLNVEMTRHVFLGLAAVRGRPARGRMVVAVDPYGLDMLSLPVESLYAGFMGTYHLGVDRLCMQRRAPSRWLVGRTAWHRLPWRFLRILSRRGEAGLVLAGGVPQTARVLYTAREFLSRLRRSRPTGDNRPDRVLAHLVEQETQFQAFLREGSAGSRPRSAWRLMEAWVAACLLGEWPRPSSETADAYSGRLSEGCRSVLWACARAMGHTEPTFLTAWRGFEQEWARETPYRERLFRLLARRLVARGTPVVLLPLLHEIRTGLPSGARGVRLRWGAPALLTREAAVASARFSRDFVAGLFS